MKEIKLTQGKIAFVDDDNYEWLNQWKWCAQRNGNNFYAKRQVTVNGKRSTIRMHILIMGERHIGLIIDHKDGNGCNNHMSNLRFCTAQENAMNSRSVNNHSSAYKGVCWHDPAKKWMVRIRINGQSIHLGLFESELDSAKAYNAAAIKYFGEFAKLNIINQ